MTAKSLMVLGTASHVGKSVIAAGLCRLLSDAGYRVAPFKAQNMSNNSFVTREGGEMGRAQVVQAGCARVEPHVDMNPVLLKPAEDNGSQVIVQGKAIGHFTAREYYAMKEKIARAVRESYERLASQYEILVMEGAGSCAEINLKENDIVNFKMAEMAGARCVLVGDIDAGGIFASLIGTLDLLSGDERARVDGLIINKFRGDRSLFDDGVELIENKTGKKIWGVIPYDSGLWIDSEDAVSVEREKTEGARHLLGGQAPSRHSEGEARRIPRDPSPPSAVQDDIDIAVIALPRLSNFTDFEILRQEPGVCLRYVRRAGELGSPDLLILPGTKSTINDLEYLAASGLREGIKKYFESGGRILGVCGGHQMLGEKIADPQGIESPKPAAEGLGIFKMTTEFSPEKILRRVAQPVNFSLFGSPVEGIIEGYEIHMGKSEIASSAFPPGLSALPPDLRSDRIGDGAGGGLLAMTESVGSVLSLRGPEGAEAIPHLFFVDPSGRAAGTYIHGLFDSASFRNSFLGALRKSCGKKNPQTAQTLSAPGLKEIHYNRLARLLSEHLNLHEIQKCLQLHLPLSLI